MVNKTTQLGGSASGISVAKAGHGLMMMTWKPTPVSDEDAFESIKVGIDSLPAGAKMVLNSGEFYGMNPRTANLELVARFFEKYPEYADKAFLSVKGGTDPEKLAPNSSPENLKRSVDTILEKLRGKKKLDLFECARVDSNYSIEETVKVLAGLVKEGKFDHIGLSECSAATLRKAHAVHPIAIVEIEVSPWSYTEETKAVIQTAKELGIALCAYSPLGRGFLTGKIKKPTDFEEGDLRRGMSRFNEDNMAKNWAIVESLTAIAEKKGITPAQLCIATLENLAGVDVELTTEELEEISTFIDSATVHGHRYYGSDEKALLWG